MAFDLYIGRMDTFEEWFGRNKPEYECAETDCEEQATWVVLVGDRSRNYLVQMGLTLYLCKEHMLQLDDHCTTEGSLEYEQ